MVTIAIADNGIGIPREALHKLGRPFEQVESQLTKRYQGSGLGLAIAKSLIEMHGGTMRICSALGDGTMVVVRLPLRSPAMPSDDAGPDNRRDRAGHKRAASWQGSGMPPMSLAAIAAA
jgi:two-component system, cell cycle sensor histidine kinase PleC